MLDSLHPTARDYLALGSAFVVQTALRSFCINSPLVFGNDLKEVRNGLFQMDVLCYFMLNWTNVEPRPN